MRGNETRREVILDRDVGPDHKRSLLCSEAIYSVCIGSS